MSALHSKMPAFMAELAEDQGTAARTLAFLVLTGCGRGLPRFSRHWRPAIEYVRHGSTRCGHGVGPDEVGFVFSNPGNKNAAEIANREVRRCPRSIGVRSRNKIQRKRGQFPRLRCST
jgi:hypothetical protein